MCAGSISAAFSSGRCRTQDDFLLPSLFHCLLVARQMPALSSLRLQHAVPEEEGDEAVNELPRLVFLRNNPPPLVLFIKLDDGERKG
eukprot:scaffold18631_cov66-Phaeocystis_antarctica.AAC.1